MLLQVQRLWLHLKNILHEAKPDLTVAEIMIKKTTETRVKKHL